MFVNTAITFWEIAGSIFLFMFVMIISLCAITFWEIAGYVFLFMFVMIISFCIIPRWM